MYFSQSSPHVNYLWVINPSPHVQSQPRNVYFWIFPFKLVPPDPWVFCWSSFSSSQIVNTFLLRWYSVFTCVHNRFLQKGNPTSLFTKRVPFSWQLRHKPCFSVIKSHSRLILNPFQHHYHPPVNSWYDTPCPKNLPFPPTCSLCSTIPEKLSSSSVYYKAKTSVLKVLPCSTKHLITCPTFITFLNPIDLSK